MTSAQDDAGGFGRENLADERRPGTQVDDRLWLRGDHLQGDRLAVPK